MFDEENLLHDDDSNYVFTTEGHILTLDPKYTKPMSVVRRKLRGAENHRCPAYTPGPAFQKQSNLGGGIVGGIQSRRDVEYARFLTDGIASELERAAWSPYGFCDIPKVEVFVRLCHGFSLLAAIEAFNFSPMTLSFPMTAELLQRIQIRTAASSR